jgi:hypothetical protein
MSNAEYALRLETEAAKGLLANLRTDGLADDAELVADTIEGETDLTEAIEAALAEIDECDVIAAGCKVKEEQFASRRSAAEKRAERVKAMIEQALLAIDLKGPMKLPGATLSLAKRARAVVITNEADVPARFFIAQPIPAPKLDKKALAAALADLATGQSIPGATLDNGSVSLTVRRK